MRVKNQSEVRTILACAPLQKEKTETTTFAQKAYGLTEHTGKREQTHTNAKRSRYTFNRGPAPADWDFWTYYSRFEGDHLVSTDGNVPHGRSSCICGLIMGAIRSEHLRRAWLRRRVRCSQRCNPRTAVCLSQGSLNSLVTRSLHREAKPFADHCLQLRARLDSVFNAVKSAEAQQGRKRTLDDIRREFTAKKTSAKRFDFFLSKYGVYLPSEPFELPIPEFP